MMVKDLVAALLKQNQNAVVVVREYDGGDDACRAVSVVKPQGMNKLAWPTCWKNNKPMKVIPAEGRQPFVIISGMEST